MKTKLSFTLAAFCFAVSVNAQKPFKELGLDDEVEVLTLSNGRYIEHFTYDTLRQIGSVMFNTVTNKVEYFISDDDLEKINVAKRNREVSRFMSVDPLTAKFPNLSPYQYASNRPIDAIDLDGLEALLVKDIILYRNSGVVKIIMTTDQNVLNNASVPLQTRLPDGTTVSGSLAINGLIEKYPFIRMAEMTSKNMADGTGGTHIVYNDPAISLSKHPARTNFAPAAMGGLQMNDFLIRPEITQAGLTMNGNISVNSSRTNNGFLSVAIPGNAQNASANFTFDQLNAEANNFSVNVLDAGGNILNTYTPTSGSTLNIPNLPAGGTINFNTTFNRGSATDDYNINGGVNYQVPVSPTQIIED